MKALGTRTPDEVNRLARRSVLLLSAVLALAVGAAAFAGWNGGPGTEPTTTITVPLARGSITPQPAAAAPTPTTGPPAEVLGVTVTEADPIATAVPATSTSTPATTTAAPTTTTAPTSTTTLPPSTTLQPTTTTTSPSTTTTVPPTTTTTVPPTTTTTVPPATTTTVPVTTTTTVVTEPSVFVWNLEAEPNCCDNDDWFADVTVEVKTDAGDEPAGVVVQAAWGGSGFGSVVVSTTDEQGIARFAIGPISAKEVTFTVLRLAHPDYRYERSLNRETSITFGPQ
jgi:hypothetical protein